MILFRKSVSILLSLIMIFSVFTIVPFVSASAANADVASAGTGETITFTTTKWVEGFEEEEGFFAFEQESYLNGLYENFIFCRVNPEMNPTADNWDAVWNQTDNLSRAGVDERDNCYYLDHYYHKENSGHDGDYWMWGNWGQYNGEQEDAVYVRADSNFTIGSAQIWAYTWKEIELTKFDAVPAGYNAETGECYEGNKEYYVSEDERYFVCNENNQDVFDEVTKEFVIEPKHQLTEHPAVEATCTVPGNTAYYECNLCHKYFSDAQGTNEIAENSWVITAHHSWEATWPTNPQPQPGISTWIISNVIFTCKSCGQSALTQGIAQKTDTTEVIADCTTDGYKSALFIAILEDGTSSEKAIVWGQKRALGHKLTAHPATEATVSADGNTAYWSCSRCGKFFSDENGENEIAENSWVIPKTAVAQYGENYTESFRDAVAHAQNETIILLKDASFEWDAELINGGHTSFKLNKNGHTLSVTFPDNYIFNESEPDVNGVITYTIAVPDNRTVTYLDINGVEQQVIACPITSGITELNDTGDTNGWYYTFNNRTIDHNVILKGNNINIILTDASNLTVNGKLYRDERENLTVYCQAGNNEGELNVKSIDVQSFTQIGGVIDVGDSINAKGDINIHGGKTTVKVTKEVQNAIQSQDGNVTITGGEIWAEGHTCIYGGTITITGGDTILKGIGTGMYATSKVIITGGKVNAAASDQEHDGRGIKSNEISLSWTNDDDYIFSQGFNTDVTLVKAFKDQNGRIYLPGMVNKDTLASKGLKPTVPVQPTFDGYSLSLNGDIAVNFFINLHDYSADNAVVNFSWGNNKTASVALSGLTPDSENIYKVPCNVAAKEMSDSITATLVINNESFSDAYSVKQYAERIIANENGEFNDETKYPNLDKLQKLCRAMVRYGDYTKNYFANGSFEVDDAINSVTSINAPAADLNSLPGGVTFEGATLSLKTETTLSLYFTSEQTLTFSCGDMTVETVKNGKYQVARIRNIPAKKLVNSFTLSVGDGSITYSPMNYCASVIEGGTSDASLINVVKALYLYAQAADQYFSN